MAKRKPRKPRPNERHEGYDSKFEHTLHNTILTNWTCHNRKVPYTIEKKYHPDFVRVIDGKEIFVEAKGRFWDHDEYSKYLHVRSCLSPDQELVFIFYEPAYPMPRSKKRKDGTKRSHAEWADDNGFKHFTMETFPEEWR